MYNDITGIILSGGKSTRMGVNKSFLKIGEQFVIEKIFNVMKSVFSELIIITNEPELYEFLGVKTYKDIYTDVGPIAGIHSGLTHSKTEKNFVISCDMPLINAEVIQSIIEYPGNAQVKVPFADGFIQQLCGLYSKTLLNLIESDINTELEETRDKLQEKRKCKVHQLIHKSESIIISDVENLAGYNENVFLNMNNVEDYNRISALSQKWHI